MWGALVASIGVGLLVSALVQFTLVPRQRKAILSSFGKCLIKMYINLCMNSYMLSIFCILIVGFIQDSFDSQSKPGETGVGGWVSHLEVQPIPQGTQVPAHHVICQLKTCNILLFPWLRKETSFPWHQPWSLLQLLAHSILTGNLIGFLNREVFVLPAMLMYFLNGFSLFLLDLVLSTLLAK